MKSNNGCITHTLTVMVDETKPTQEITREGGYEWRCMDAPNVKFHHKDGVRGEKNIAVFCFGKEMTSEQVVVEMGKEGYRPGEIHELLALGIIQPEIFREDPVIALDCFYRGFYGPYVVVMYSSIISSRALILEYFDSTWSSCCQFVGVRK